MTPSELYAQKCLKLNLNKDPQQEKVVGLFDQLHTELMQRSLQRPGLWARWFNRQAKTSPQGIYLWGGVGRGKTMLMDIFYETLPNIRRERLHFHHFMNRTHNELRKYKDQQNPLKLVAKSISNHSRVLCLDELYVNDITDAMLMSGLLSTLFEQGVCFVITSNIPPADLYKNGLQRQRFMPAIQLLQKNLRTINLDNDIDYRLKTLRKSGTYYFPLNEDTEQRMHSIFDTLTSHQQWAKNTIEINHRKIPILGHAEGAVWFDFDSLCNSPRSQVDYLEIAREHHSMLLSNVPALNNEHDDAVRRLVNLIDILYDHHVKLVISAATPIEEIYSGKRLAFEFERATSRLIEMQSERYLAQHHTP